MAAPWGRPDYTPCHPGPYDLIWLWVLLGILGVAVIITSIIVPIDLENASRNELDKVEEKVAVPVEDPVDPMDKIDMFNSFISRDWSDVHSL